MTMSRRHKDNLIGALLVLCVATPIVWWTGDTAKKTDTTAETLARQQEGRKVAIEVLCGFASAVSDAGRKTIAGGVALPGRTKRDADRIVLDKHGASSAWCRAGSPGSSRRTATRAASATAAQAK
jgi:hypothetical protein